MSLLRRKKSALSRTSAMSCRPVKLPIVARSDLDGDRARVTVELARPRWLQWLTGANTYERTYGLDAFGVEIYDACDGRRNVRKICRVFARDHKLSIAEAEHAVTKFLRTLMVKGLVQMVGDREA